MFPGSNSNADMGYNKHNQYMAQPPHFLGAPVPGSSSVPGAGLTNPLAVAAPVLPMGVQGTIDWARLAQQWIHMRDSSAAPPVANFSMNMPIAPPPPIISNAPEYQLHLQQQPQQLGQQQPSAQTHYEEHGEAEMDMDMDEEDNEGTARATHAFENLPPPPVITQSQWMSGGTNDLSNATSTSSNNTICPGPPQWNEWSARSNPTAHIPSLLKINVCNPNEPRGQQPPHQPLPRNSVPSGPPGAGTAGGVGSDIDAKKRKLLPAWIREGLEKMEREKQRQLERQQALPEEPEMPAANVKQVSSKTLTTPVNLLNISNVASDSEDSIATALEATHTPSHTELKGNDVLSKTSNSGDEQDHYEDDEAQQQEQQQNVQTLKQLSDSSRDGVAAAVSNAGSVNVDAALGGKNYEERLADLMLVVRRTLTEILLETTNEEIAAIATETLKAHRAKASSAQVIRKSALSSITGNLGLAAYGDSSSESEDDNADDNDGGQIERNCDSSADKPGELSTDELKMRIRKSKRAFEKVIDDIEERVLLQEQLDEQRLQHFRKLELEKTETVRHQSEQRETEAHVQETELATTPASDNDRIQKFHAKRQRRKERTTRFSDNKDGKQPQSFVSQVVVVPPVQPAIVPAQIKPVPNPATNLLQMPESMATMLHAADKALDKATKTAKKSKSKRSRSSSSLSTSSTSSSSSSSSSDSSSSSSKSSSHSESSSTRSSTTRKKRGKSKRRQSRGSSGNRQRSDADHKRRHRGQSATSSHTYERHRSSRDRRDHHSSRDSRDRERNRERDRERRGARHSRQEQVRRRRRDSSHSAEENRSSSSYLRDSRPKSDRRRESRSNYGKHSGRTRSRSNSRSTHNSHSSVSTSASHHRHRPRK